MHRATEDWRSMSSGSNYRASPSRNRSRVSGHEALHHNDQSGYSRVPPSFVQPADERAGAYDPWRFFEERAGTGPYGSASFPYQPRPSIQILVVSDGGIERINPNLPPRLVPADHPPPRVVRGQRHTESAPPAARSVSIGGQSFKKVMSMMRKQIFSPTYPRKRAWKRGLFSSAHADSKGGDREEDQDVDDDAGTECAICLEAFQPNEQVLATPCNHMFHHDCLVPWVKSNGKCPVCRFVFYEKRESIAPNANNNNNNNNNRNGSSQIMEEDLLALIRAMDMG